MKIKQIAEILEPTLNILTKDKMEYRDYKKISMERPDIYSNPKNYKQLLWYSNFYSIAINIFEYKDKIRLKFEENDLVRLDKYIHKDEVNVYVIHYFIEYCKTFFSWKKKIYEMGSMIDNPPKDFIREHRLKGILG